jgi:hypothetical protein
MSLAANRTIAGGEGGGRFAIEDISTGLHASGFGQVGDGRSFAFRVERRQLIVEIYRPRLAGPVPQAEDMVAMATRGVSGIDLTDEGSLSAVVRDAVSDARPIPRPIPRPSSR